MKRSRAQSKLQKNRRKLVVFGALGLLSFAAPLHASIETGVVGYTTIDLKAGYNLISCRFEGLSEDATISIHDLFAGATFDAGDRIMFYNDSGEYTTYSYVDDLVDPETWMPTGTPGWGDILGLKTERPIHAGDAFWVHLKKPRQVTISGVVKIDNQEIELKPGLNLVSMAYPGANFSSAANLKVIEEAKFAPDSRLMISNGDTYTTYSYVENLLDPNTWQPTGTPGWGNILGQKAEIEIPENAGFWLSAKEAMKLTFSSPLATSDETK